jgi:hypothetical protein
MGVWDHLPPDVVARRTKNYGLAGGYLIPPPALGAMTCPLCDGEGVLRAALPRKDRDE